MTTNTTPSASDYALRLVALPIGSPAWREVRDEIRSADLLAQVRDALGRLAAQALGHANKLKARG